MIKSMTGYGKGETIANNKHWVVEIKSVNHRFLDISVKMPRSHSMLEERIHKEIKKRIFRGRVDVYVKIQDMGQEDKQIMLDTGLAKAYYSVLGRIAADFSLDSKINLMDIASMPDVLVMKDPEYNLDDDWQHLQKVVALAVGQLVKMRSQEGVELYQDFKNKIELLKKACLHLSQQAPVVTTEYQEKLEKKLKDYLTGTEIDKTRILTEVAIMVDKMSIDEEIVRLKSHLQQFAKEIDSTDAVGRKLDFLIQEMNREINTVGSKSSNYEISHLVVEVKTLIEKIREQVQNIE